MANRYSKEKLHRLRNEVPISRLISEFLDIPCKVSEGYFRFLCPLCGEFQTATNPKTNLARCFRCQKNFNPIDMVMAVKSCNFREAVESIDGLQDR
jgi:DNA primase